ncbi:MAG: glutamate--tRNA ligase [Deltaproteobacteria bacterium]|nr:glutamate--tRNA ligase [Deltaproteobacteria bacterium]
MTEIRTRFAPSPTGFLHIGGARTALFNYLFARRHGGRFILRIEDSDRERSTDQFTEAILEGLAWLGLDFDEGPFFQSHRSAYYRTQIDKMLGSGSAYWCFCSAEELDGKRKMAQAQGRAGSYDRNCRDLRRTPGEGEAAVIRLRMPLDGSTVVHDLIRGDIVFDNRELDDLVVVRSDGTPTFHLVNVADDIDMGITHILRGEDHITNTPRQIQIFRALGAKPPLYGHMPLIVGKDRARLSKRHGATSVLAYREAGFLPEATLNYLARLGWSHGDQEIFSRAELVSAFDAAAINKSAAAFDMEKFAWVNFEHMKSKSANELTRAVRPYLAERGCGGYDERYLETAAALVRDRAKTLVELADQLAPFVGDTIAYDQAAAEKFLGEADRARLRGLADELDSLVQWNAPAVEREFRAFCEGEGIKLGALAQPARVALTGGTASAGIFEMCAVFGRARTVARLRAACAEAEAGALTFRAPASPQPGR